MAERRSRRCHSSHGKAGCLKILKGPLIPPVRLDQPLWAHRALTPLALTFLYHFVRRVIEAVRVHWMATVAKDAEILVLRARSWPGIGAKPPHPRLHLAGSSGPARPGDLTQCRRLETTLITRAMITAPNRYENIAWTRAICLIDLEVRFVSDTWKVIPMVNAK